MQCERTWQHGEQERICRNDVYPVVSEAPAHVIQQRSTHCIESEPFSKLRAERVPHAHYDRCVLFACVHFFVARQVICKMTCGPQCFFVAHINVNEVARHERFTSFQKITAQLLRLTSGDVKIRSCSNVFILDPAHRKQQVKQYDTRCLIVCVCGAFAAFTSPICARQ